MPLCSLKTLQKRSQKGAALTSSAQMFMMERKVEGLKRERAVLRYEVGVKSLNALLSITVLKLFPAAVSGRRKGEKEMETGRVQSLVQ
jgi:hypothetical protein